MLFTLKRSCKDCPFSKTLPPYLKGWLGKMRAIEISESVLAGYVFPCHKTLHLDRQIACAGAQAFHQHHKQRGELAKSSRDNYRAAQCLELVGANEPLPQDTLDDSFSTKQAFIDFHTEDD